MLYDNIQWRIVATVVCRYVNRKDRANIARTLELKLKCNRSIDWPTASSMMVQSGSGRQETADKKWKRKDSGRQEPFLYSVLYIKFKSCWRDKWVNNCYVSILMFNTDWRCYWMYGK